MEELFPLLFIIFVWSLIGSSIRKVLKGAKNQQSSAKKGASAGSEKKPAAGSRSGLRNSTSGSSRSIAAHDWGSMGGPDTEGTDPCHDDPYSMPAGSLNVSEAEEGTDPCHDDPYSMPLGSLAVDHPEGTDPCHPAPGADHPDSGVSSGAQSSGLNLRFGGSDIVQGFVWGEILNRKRA